MVHINRNLTNADLPGVVRVIPHRILSLQTTRSRDFLQVNPHIANGILSKGQSGVGSIIGVMDTGLYDNAVYIHCLSWIPSSIPVVQEYGLNQKVSVMRGWERFHLVGKGYAKKENNSIVPIVIG